MPQEASNTRSLPLLSRVDAACLRFEDRWRAGERPELEAFLNEFPEEDRSALLPELLLLEWEYRSRRSEPYACEEYALRFPRWATVVTEAWRVWQEECLKPRPPWESTQLPAANLDTIDRLATQVALSPSPGYECYEPLGKGGMGEVYKAFDPLLKRWVAVKQVRVDRARPELLARFRLEAETLGKLQHPHIVKVHSCVENNGQPVLVMEYVAGGTLGELLSGPLPPAEAARLTAVLAWTVHAAHEKGVVHRDLKPANVLMDEPVPGNPGNVLGGFPKVSDFGLAMLAGEATGQTATGAVLGTPAYMAPEQAAGRTRDVGPKADVWALGVILYRCLTGELPFVGDSVLDTLERIKTMQFRPVREVCLDAPEELAEVCMACLRKEPGDRPTAAELAAQLDRLAGGPLPTSARSEARPTRGGPERVVRQSSIEGFGKPEAQARDALAVTATYQSKVDGIPARRWWAWWAAGAGLAAAAAVLALAAWLGRSGPVGDDKGEAEALTAKVEVIQWEVRPGKTVPVGVIGKDVFEVPFGGRVTVDVSLSAPGFAYLLALNANGKEQLLWPVNDAGKPDARVAPPLLQKFRYPARKGEKGRSVVFRLDDEPKGGLQGFAVVASRESLPSWREWEKQHGKAAWRRVTAEGVWCADGRGTHPVLAGQVVRGKRGEEEEVEGAPPLAEVVESLGRAEAVTVWAFPVGKKE
jgi:hypothetical protein